MHVQHCFCAEIPRIELTTRVVLVMHGRESTKISNSGRLAALALPNHAVLTHGLPGQPLDARELQDPARQPILLVGTASAPPLDPDELARDGRPVTLVVPDGTWRQVRKMPRRIPALRALPRRRLPGGPPSAYRLRTAPHPHQLATCEAIGRALRLLEGPEVQRALDRLLAAMVERVLLDRAGLGGAFNTGQ